MNWYPGVHAGLPGLEHESWEEHFPVEPISILNSACRSNFEVGSGLTPRSRFLSAFVQESGCMHWRQESVLWLTTSGLHELRIVASWNRQGNSEKDDIQFAYCALTIIILHLNMNFGRELVVLLTTPAMFGKFPRHGGR